jgi:type IX secretion system PorP/SprF family membrane protein
MRQIVHTLAFSLLFMAHLSGQDLHFSQFYNQPQHVNPALTGVFAGEWRAGIQYRSQWETVPVQYRTGAAWADYKWLTQKRFLVSTGVLIQSDQAGDAGMTWTQGGANVSVAHALGANQALSAGFGVMLVQRRMDLSGLTFKNQWDGDVFNPALPSKETLPNSSDMAPSMSAGLNWHYEPGTTTRTRIDIGVGALHLNRPKVNFADAENFALPVRWTGSAQARVQVRDRVDAVGFGLYQRMSTAQEFIIGGGARAVLDPANNMAAQFTLGWRAGDALIPAIQLEWGAWTAGLSYDWNISGFQAVTRGRGGVELALIYRQQPVQPPKTFKSCPIF